MGRGGVGIGLSGAVGRLIVVCVIAAGLTAACGVSEGTRDTSTIASSSSPSSQGAPSATAARTASAAGCLVGASWFNASHEAVGTWEEPAIQKLVSGAGGSFKSANAKSDGQAQAGDIDALVAAGARVIVVEPGGGPDATAILPAVRRATDAGVAVLTVGRPIDNPRALYVAFDPVETGRMEASALLAVRPKGNYAIIKGDSSLPEGDLLVSGVNEILQKAVDRGDIRIVAIAETPVWDPGNAVQEMTKILSDNEYKVDAVLAVRDSLAMAAESVLKGVGLDGKIAVAGVYDPDSGAGFIGIIRGSQAVEVWGNPELLAAAAGRAAVALCGNPDVTKVEGSAPFTWPGHSPMTAVLLEPLVITRDNLDVVIHTSIEWRHRICDGLDPSEAPPACQLTPAG